MSLLCKKVEKEHKITFAMFIHWFFSAQKNQNYLRVNNFAPAFVNVLHFQRFSNRICNKRSLKNEKKKKHHDERENVYRIAVKKKKVTL